jgi:hypothetical protein
MRHLKKAFLDAFAQTGIVRAAAEAAGVGRASVYRWLEHDDAFALAFRQAEEESTQRLEQEAFRRATRPIEPSDTLLIFLLKARRPERYRDRVDVRQQVEATVAHVEALRAHVEEADVERLTRALLGGEDG